MRKMMMDLYLADNL